MTAVLIVNPKATTTSERARDILVRALRSAVDLNVEYTRQRGHGAALARRAADEGVDLVVTLGGDGTVNEVVNGLLEPGRGPLETPRLAVVPGGSTNVFARALGLPVDWVDGTGVILDALRDNRSRTIGLGRANGRYFTFCAGFGLDAAAIGRVERARVRGESATPALYVRSTLAQYFSGADRRHPGIRLTVPGRASHDRLGLAIVQNTTPWTFLGSRPVSPNPRASFDTGLDVLSLNQMNLATTIHTASQLLTGRKALRGKHVVAYHDLKNFRLTSARPRAFQLDGDYLGECDAVELESAPEVLRVVCLAFWIPAPRHRAKNLLKNHNTAGLSTTFASGLKRVERELPDKSGHKPREFPHDAQDFRNFPLDIALVRESIHKRGCWY